MNGVMLDPRGRRVTLEDFTYTPHQLARDSWFLAAGIRFRTELTIAHANQHVGMFPQPSSIGVTKPVPTIHAHRFS